VASIAKKIKNWYNRTDKVVCPDSRV
jgi:hypothetical protein